MTLSDGYIQQGLTLQAIRDAGLDPVEVWIAYFGMGGTADPVHVLDYLRGSALIPPLQRDIVSRAVSEVLFDGGLLCGGQGAKGARRPAGASAADPGSAAGIDGVALPPSMDFDPAVATTASAGALLHGDVPVQDPGAQESRRVASLERTGLLETGAEERFDRITRRAREFFQVGVAAIGFLTHDRYVTKSAAGRVEAYLPRQEVMCNRTIRTTRALVVPDARQDDRFRNLRFVRSEPGIRFYAGHALRGPGGLLIGTFCVADTRPRHFAREDERALRVYAAQAQMEICL